MDSESEESQVLRQKLDNLKLSQFDHVAVSCNDLKLAKCYITPTEILPMPD